MQPKLNKIKQSNNNNTASFALSTCRLLFFQLCPMAMPMQKMHNCTQQLAPFSLMPLLSIESSMSVNLDVSAILEAKCDELAAMLFASGGRPTGCNDCNVFSFDSHMWLATSRVHQLQAGRLRLQNLACCHVCLFHQNVCCVICDRLCLICSWHTWECHILRLNWEVSHLWPIAGQSPFCNDSNDSTISKALIESA